jgi:hypothetical protein
MKRRLLGSIALLLAFAGSARAEESSWQHSGSLFVLTTPEGADLPATASVDDFPLLVRLDKDWFDFSQARPDGADIRFFTAEGSPLPYQIELWDAAEGVAAIWVRIPEIRGNARQEIKMHWGNPAAAHASDGRAVFNASNGYVSVWHMDQTVTDEVGTLESNDTGTADVAGIIGRARRFPGGKGVFCGDKIEKLPSGAAPHSSQAWFRPETINSTVLAWGNEQAQGKVVMQFASPPHVRADCYFSDGNVASDGRLSRNQWLHVVHTYQQGDSRIYVNGVLAGQGPTRGTPLSIQSPARLWIGGWYNNYNFTGDIDEVRISRVVRSADWVRLEYENQKPLQTLVGPIVRQGTAFSVSPDRLTVREGASAVITAQADGAQKIYWFIRQDGEETLAAVDRLAFRFDAGRVAGDTSLTIRLKAIYPDGVRTLDIPVTVQEAIPEPSVALSAPAAWDGRQPLELLPTVNNLRELQEHDAADLTTTWEVSGMAVIQETGPGKLVLKRAQNSGKLTVTATVSNGGQPATATATIAVTEPTVDAWVDRQPSADEMPVDGQFYARDDKNEGTLHANGTLDEPADSVFLRVYCDDQPYQQRTQNLADGKQYALSAKLKPGLVKYRVDFGARRGDRETVLHRADNIVCGDAYIIQGQSNALATDTREEAPRETNTWIRSFGSHQDQDYHQKLGQNLWCNPVWKFERGEAHGPSRREHKAELGWWGMELAKRLLESQQIPICIINGAVGGTRIDQHQRNPEIPEDLQTIYGRLLWRVREARLTHGVRAVLWHQGESDQGADGPSGGYGWETYQRYFVNLSAGWKQDFPNLQQYYIYQIWPRSCSMGRDGSDNRLREVQRTLPRLYSNMGIMSTLGIQPPGTCHYPLEGWSEFAHTIQPLIERDLYGKAPADSVTPPDLKHAYYTSDAKDEVALEFDQPVVWKEALASEFYVDGQNGEVASGAVAGNVLTLALKQASTAGTITYLDSRSWSQDRLLDGANGIAALTFCEVPISSAKPAR